MDLRINFDDLSKRENVLRLINTITQLAEQLNVLYTETAPDGAIAARIGRVALYKNGGNYEQWQNVDGGTTWMQVAVLV